MDALKTFSMHITKSSLSGGEMKWAATNSDTSPDLYGERMSLELYKSMLGKISRKEPPPPAFAKLVVSDWWKGGMPYVSLAHYPDGNGKAVPGMPNKLYIDGTALKAKGMFYDTKLGRAVWKALKEDEANTTPDKIRISIAFLDLSHKHGEDGQVFVRESASGVCPQCLAGIGDKIYLDGYLVHLALTRVPVNPRTLMTVEKTMAGKTKTRKDDALSIVQDADLLEEVVASALESKSDVLVEMSDTEIPEPVVEDAMASKEEEKSPADDEEDAEEGKKTKEKEMPKKSLSAEDISAIAEVVKSLLPAAVEAPAKVEKSALDLSVEKLYDSVAQAVEMKNSTIEQRLESINPVLQELGLAITDQVKSAVGVEAHPVAASDGGVVLEALTSLTNSVKSLAEEIAVIKAQQVAPTASQRVPTPRSVTPQIQIQASLTTDKPVNPNSVTNIVRRSVSSDLPLK